MCTRRKSPKVRRKAAFSYEFPGDERHCRHDRYQMLGERASGVVIKTFTGLATPVALKPAVRPAAPGALGAHQAPADLFSELNRRREYVGGISKCLGSLDINYQVKFSGAIKRKFDRLSAYPVWHLRLEGYCHS